MSEQSEFSGAAHNKRLKKYVLDILAVVELQTIIHLYMAYGMF